MFVVASYDIPDDRRRTRMANILMDFGKRIQYSVFECVLSEEQLREMLRRVERVVEPQEDRVRIYRLCRQCLNDVKIIGLGEITEDPEVYIL